MWTSHMLCGSRFEKIRRLIYSSFLLVARYGWIFLCHNLLVHEMELAVTEAD